MKIKVQPFDVESQLERIDEVKCHDWFVAYHTYEA